MSITANDIDVASYVGDDFNYVTIGVTWKGKKYLEVPTECERTQVMWSHESPFGVVGSQVGDFVGCYGDSSALQEGVFTHRHIAELLCKTFTGLKYHELDWHENPLEKMLASGKPRLKKAKWLPEKEVDLVHLFSDVYVDVSHPTAVETDFFTVLRWHESIKNKKKIKWKISWFMCGDTAAEKLNNMNYTCLYITQRTIGKLD